MRAYRRWLELSEKDADLTVEAVLAQQQERDKRDTDRAVAPLRAADDAVLLDTSDMTIEQATAQAIAVINARLDAA